MDMSQEQASPEKSNQDIGDHLVVENNNQEAPADEQNQILSVDD